MQSSFYHFIEQNQDKFGYEYESFLENQGGFPSMNSRKNWTLAKIIPKDRTKEEYFKSLAEHIIHESDSFIQLSGIENLIIKFNAKWTEARIPIKKSEKCTENEEIRFNSKSENYAWLSNFFETLIHSEKPTPGIFIGVESAYKSYKAFFAGEDAETVQQIGRMIDQRKAKKIQHDLPQERKIRLMSRLIHYKFTQNPVLAKKLQATADRILIECTDNPYWGNGTSTASLEAGNGLNMLGKIIMKERASYRESLHLDSLGTEGDDDNHANEIDEITDAVNQISFFIKNPYSKMEDSLGTDADDDIDALTLSFNRLRTETSNINAKSSSKEEDSNIPSELDEG